MVRYCRICGNEQGNRIHQTREMMFGTRDTFEYLECGQCGTLQIVDIPDLSLYYPRDYYSLDESTNIEIAKNIRRRVAAKYIGKQLLYGNSMLGRWLVAKRPHLPDQFPLSLREPILNLNFHSRILDFGCGRGGLLQTLYYFGFQNLTGADAFIDDDLSYSTGVVVLKRPLAELEPDFDLIMFNHSFEHLPNPRESFLHLQRLLAPDGIALIRIPIVNYAWEKYDVNWVQLDAPRHLFLYTERAFLRLAEEAGFIVEKVAYDSGAFQFFASEQYLKDIPLLDPVAYRGVASESIFTESQIEEWESLAARLNAEGRGDQACFYLRKA